MSGQDAGGRGGEQEELVLLHTERPAREGPNQWMRVLSRLAPPEPGGGGVDWDTGGPVAPQSRRWTEVMGVAAAFSLLVGMAGLSSVHCGKSRFTRSQEAIYDYRTALGAAQNQYRAETARPQREKCCDEPMNG